MMIRDPEAPGPETSSPTPFAWPKDDGFRPPRYPKRARKLLFHEAGTGGHGATETFDDRIVEAALKSAFLLDRLGVTGGGARTVGEGE